MDTAMKCNECTLNPETCQIQECRYPRRHWWSPSLWSILIFPSVGIPLPTSLEVERQARVADLKTECSLVLKIGAKIKENG